MQLKLEWLELRPALASQSVESVGKHMEVDQRDDSDMEKEGLKPLPWSQVVFDQLNTREGLLMIAKPGM